MGTAEKQGRNTAKKATSLFMAAVMVASMTLPAGVPDEAYAAQSRAKVSAGVIAGSAQSKKAPAKKSEKITLTLARANASLKVGGTYKIVAKATKGSTVQFASSKKSVATVTGKGVVKAKAAGKATVTVTAKKGKKSVKKTVKVAVSKPAKKSQQPPTKAVEAPDVTASGEIVSDGTQSEEAYFAANNAEGTEAAAAPAADVFQVDVDAAGDDRAVISEAAAVEGSGDGSADDAALEVVAGAVSAVTGTLYGSSSDGGAGESDAPVFELVGPATTVSGSLWGAQTKRGVVVECGNTYYYKNDGAKAYGWVTEDGVTRYCDPTTGVMAKGGEVWIASGKNGRMPMAAGYRYFGSDGAMFCGWKTINGKAKYFRPSSGLRSQGEVDIRKGECGTAVSGVRYFDANGSIVLGWRTVGGVDKYFEPSHGVRAEGITQVFHPGGSNWYYFKPGTGERAADMSAGDFWFRSGDGVGVRYDSAEYARLVFNEYNKFRLTRSNASRGHYCVLWSGDSNYGAGCGDAFEAKLSTRECASQGRLVHTAYKRRSGWWKNGLYMSDILASSSGIPSPHGLIRMWENSPGHRKMMQCDTAHHAGFSVTKGSNGVYYYAIVYEWNNYNTSGN